MDVLYARCAGFDVHKKTVRVCLLLRQEHGKTHKEFRTYSTTTQDLLNLLDWLLSQECTHVALEGTGVYWKPVYNLFEGQIEVLVVNAKPYQSGARPENRYQRRRVDCRSPAAWTAQSELYPFRSAKRTP